MQLSFLRIPFATKLFAVHFFCIGILYQTLSAQQRTSDPWGQVEDIRCQINPPSFKSQRYKVTDFGAVADGTTKCTEAFKKAIAICNKNGGGMVIVPKGTFLTGAIHLKSNVNLHLESGAKILFSKDAKDYLPVVFTRYEGMELMNYSPFIYAYGQKNIAITGNGILDGAGGNDAWWPWKGVKAFGWNEGVPNEKADRDLLQQLTKKQVVAGKRVFGEGHYIRPNFVQFYKCKNILISGIQLVHSPMWNIHPVLCENVTIENVRVESTGPNNDGCNPESCKNVLIRNCFFNTGDDCIAIKSGRNEDGRRINKASRNIIIEHCRMEQGHGSVVIGSEISGGVQNVFIQNCSMNSPLLQQVLKIKTSSRRGGTTNGIFMRNITVGTYKYHALEITMFYEDAGGYMPVVKNIRIENMTVQQGGKYGVFVNAYPESPVENLVIVNSTINCVQFPVQVNYVKNWTFSNFLINGEIITAKKVAKPVNQN